MRGGPGGLRLAMSMAGSERQDVTFDSWGERCAAWLRTTQGIEYRSNCGQSWVIPRNIKKVAQRTSQTEIRFRQPNRNMGIHVTDQISDQSFSISACIRLACGCKATK